MSTSLNSTESYFYTPALKGLIQQLTHLAFFGDGISVATGQKGSGKSALAAELVGHLDQAHDVVSISLNSDLELAECIEKISRALGVAQVDALSVGEMLSELRAFVQTLSHEDKLVVLIIDDAHHLDDQAVGALVSLLQGAHQSHAGLHLVLFSEPGLDRRIDALQIIDVAVYDFELPHLSPSELSQFLARDPAIESQLNSSLVQKIWVSSQGLPGSALSLVREQGQPSESSVGRLRGRFDFGIPYGHIAAIGLLALVLFWSLLGRNNDSPAPVTTKIAKPIIEAPATAVLNDSIERYAALPEKVPPPVVYEEPYEETESEPERVQNSAAEPAVVNSEAVVLQKTPPSEAYTESVEKDGSRDDLELNEQAYDPNSEPQIPERMPEATKEEVIESLPRRMSESLPKALNDAEVFLMAQNSDFYTLQVIAASKKASLDTYVARQSNRDALYMYRGKREGKSWYVVVQGVYSSRESALQGLRMLPKEQSKAGPWPRKLSAIQEEIEEFRLD